MAPALVLIFCSGEREWRDANRVLMPAQANEDSAASSQAEASSGEPDDGRSSVAASGRRTVAEVDASRRADPESRSASSVGGGNAAEVQSYGAAASPHEVKSVTATETRPGSQTAAIDPHRLHKELRPFRLGTRLLLRGLAVMPDESARIMWPRFSAAVVDYVAAVPHDIGQVTPEAAPLRPGDAALSYRAADGAVPPDADPESVGPQVDLSPNEPTPLELTVSHGTQSRRYRVRLIRFGPLFRTLTY